MTEMAAGWYIDPAPANPATPTTMRFWDGKEWTPRVRAASRRELTGWREQVQAEQMAMAVQHAEYVAEHGGYDPGPAGMAALPRSRDFTPDGQPLAGWWSRVAAWCIDGILTSVLSALFGWQQISRIGQAITDYSQAAVQASQAGSTPPDVSLVVDSLRGPLLALVAVAWGVRLVYGVGFLKAFGATPGKMLLKIEVRLRARPGPMPWATVLLRWFAQNLAGLAGLVPLVSLLGWVYRLLDDLWPLWDGQRQALHDKVARTNVVRR
jgi:uncharacterized RDD family membrane protein YckC